MRLTRTCFTSLMLCAISATASAQTYRITALEMPADALGANAAALDDRGDVGGDVFSLNATEPVIWPSSGAMQTLPTLDGTNAVNRGNSVNAINDRGVAVGQSELATGQAFGALWESGSVVELMPLAAFAQGSSANAINDFGWIAGVSEGAGRNSARATLWIKGRPTALPTTTYASDAMSINDLGEVAGWSSTSLTSPGPDHATLWDAVRGTTVDLGTLPGDDESRANGINDRGQVVGYSASASGQPAQSPVLWENGSITSLGLPRGVGATSAVAMAINDMDQIVGYSISAGPCELCFHATLWQNGVAVDLNTLIAPSDPLKGTAQFEVAESINDRGQILVEGNSANQSRVYLLTPVAQ